MTSPCNPGQQATRLRADVGDCAGVPSGTSGTWRPPSPDPASPSSPPRRPSRSPTRTTTRTPRARGWPAPRVVPVVSTRCRRTAAQNTGKRKARLGPPSTAHYYHGREHVLGTEDVVHIRAMSADGVVGLSPIHPARAALGLSKQLVEQASSYMSHDAGPSGLLKTLEARRASRTSSSAGTRSYKGRRNAGRMAVVGPETDFVPLSMPADEMQFVEQRRLSASEVARIFRVPPWIIGAHSATPAIRGRLLRCRAGEAFLRGRVARSSGRLSKESARFSLRSRWSAKRNTHADFKRRWRRGS